MNPTRGGSSSKQDVLRTYLGMLDCLTLRKLFERYLCLQQDKLYLIPNNLIHARYYADFLLFDYSLVEILGLARNAPCKNLEKRNT